MRDWSRLLTALGIAALVVALITAYPLRNSDGGALTAPVLLALLGLAAVVAALALMVLAERDVTDLTVSDDQASSLTAAGGAPGPSWWAPLAVAATAVAATGLMVSDILLGLGLGLLAAAVTAGAWETAALVRQKSQRNPTDPAPLDRSAVRTARRIQRFAAEHADGDDASVHVVLENVGRYGVKLVLVGADGRFGELMATDVPRAELAGRLAGANVSSGEFERELTARMRQTPQEWSRMGGVSASVPPEVAARTA